MDVCILGPIPTRFCLSGAHIAMPRLGSPTPLVSSMKRSIYVGAGLALLAAAVPLAMRMSPWPGALMVKRLFKLGAQQTQAHLERFCPSDVQADEDIAYGSHPDERLDVYRPVSHDGPLPVLVWVHGGGWISGNRKTVASWLKLIAQQGYACVAVGYSTASASVRYPTPVRQVCQALDFLHTHAQTLDLDTHRLVLGGSSAGAQISAQVALLGSSCYARRIGLAPPAVLSHLRATVLLSGAFDIHGVGDNWFVNSLLWAYTGNRDFRRDPHLQLMAITPNLTTRFPPSFITSGNADPLEYQAHDLVKRMQILSIDVDALFFSGPTSQRLQHEYHFELDCPEARTALMRLLEFLGRVTARPSVELATIRAAG